MSDFRRIQLSNLVDRVEKWNPGKDSPEEIIEYIDISAIDRDSKKISEITHVLGNNAPSRARQLVKTDDVLVSTVRPNLNAVAQVKKELDGATASTGYCVLRPKNRSFNSRYLFHWVRTPAFIDNMMLLATGASYPAVSDKIVKASKIPLPPLAEQQRIAAILDKADALRAQRRTALAKLDTLLQATFLHMFGDPVTNPMGWEIKNLDKFGKIVTGSTPSRKEPKYYGDYIEWIKSDNINTPYHILTPAQEFLSEAGLNVGRFVPENSVLVTCIAGSPDCIGNAAIADRAVAFNQQINAITPNQNGTTNFLYIQFLVGKRLVQGASTNSMKGMVSKSSFSNVEFISPPLEMQQKFSQKATKIQSEVDKQTHSLKNLDNLFYTLQQRAFKGKL